MLHFDVYAGLCCVNIWYSMMVENGLQIAIRLYVYYIYVYI